MVLTGIRGDRRFGGRDEPALEPQASARKARQLARSATCMFKKIWHQSCKKSMKNVSQKAEES